MLRLLENLTFGPGAAVYLSESLHGVGAPYAQSIILARLADLEAKGAKRPVWSGSLANQQEIL